MIFTSTKGSFQRFIFTNLQTNIHWFIITKIHQILISTNWSAFANFVAGDILCDTLSKWHWSGMALKKSCTLQESCIFLFLHSRLTKFILTFLGKAQVYASISYAHTLLTYACGFLPWCRFLSIFTLPLLTLLKSIHVGWCRFFD